MDYKKRGSWIIATQKHLQEFSSPYLSLYDATLISGKAGRLMAKIRKMEVIDSEEKLSVMASSIGIQPTELRKIILPLLEEKGIIDVHRDSTGIKKIEENVPREEKILKITTEIWEDSDPRPIEEASLENIEYSTILPRTKSEVISLLDSKGYDTKVVNSTLELQKSFDLIRIEQIPGVDEPIVYTEYTWGENASKIVHLLKRLDSPQKSKIETLIQIVSKNQALPLELIAKSLPSDLLNNTRKTGAIDVVRVSTSGGVEKLFVLTPRMFGTLKGKLVNDICDQVKLFLSCIRFGQHYSRISRVRDPVALVRALVERGSIGPATPIGTDYVMLEVEGIVKLRPAGGGMYYMDLVKDDVAKLTLQILEHGEILPFDTAGELHNLYLTGMFTNPEQDRIKLKRAPTESKIAQELLIKTLRGQEL